MSTSDGAGPQPAATLQVTAGGDCTITGDLSFATVADLHEQALGLFAGNQPRIVDMQTVARVDSAGVALMLDWIRRSRARRQTLTFRNVPQQMISIAELCGVGHLFHS